MKYSFIKDVELPEGYDLYPFTMASVEFENAENISLYDWDRGIFVEGLICFADVNRGLYIAEDYSEGDRTYTLYKNPSLVLITPTPELFDEGVEFRKTIWE